MLNGFLLNGAVISEPQLYYIFKPIVATKAASNSMTLQIGVVQFLTVFTIGE